MQELIAYLGEENARQEKEIHFFDAWSEVRGSCSGCEDCCHGRACKHNVGEIAHYSYSKYTFYSFSMLEEVHPKALQALVYLVQQKKIACPEITQEALLAYAWKQFLPEMEEGNPIKTRWDISYLNHSALHMKERVFNAVILDAISQQVEHIAAEEKEEEKECRSEGKYYYSVLWEEPKDLYAHDDFYAYAHVSFFPTQEGWCISYHAKHVGARKTIPLSPNQTQQFLNSRIPRIQKGLSENTPLPVPDITSIVLNYLEGEIGQEEIPCTNPFHIVMNPAQQTILAAIFSEVSIAQQEFAAIEAIVQFEQLLAEVKRALVDMEQNPLYTASSNKLRVVRMLDATLEKVLLEYKNVLKEKGAEACLRTCRIQLDRAVALASIIIMYNTKRSRMARFISFFGKSGEPTEITQFWLWLTRAKHALIGYDEAFRNLKGMLSRSIQEIGVLDTQKPFRSLLEKIDQPGVDGEALLYGFIATGTLVPIKGLGIAQKKSAVAQEESRAAAAP